MKRGSDHQNVTKNQNLLAHSLEKCPFKNYDENFSIFFGLKVFSGHHGSSPNTRLGLRSETQLSITKIFLSSSVRN